MTSDHKYLINELLDPDSDAYLIKMPHTRKRKQWRLMKGNQMSVCYVSHGAVKKYNRLFKKDHRDRFTFNLTLVRQERGNSYIKKQYRKRTYVNPSL